jgi:hypothetical protein
MFFFKINTPAPIRSANLRTQGTHHHPSAALWARITKSPNHQIITSSNHQTTKLIAFPTFNFQHSTQKQNHSY